MIININALFLKGVSIHMAGHFFLSVIYLFKWTAHANFTVSGFYTDYFCMLVSSLPNSMALWPLNADHCLETLLLSEKVFHVTDFVHFPQGS